VLSKKYKALILSELVHTWLIDLDGTVLVHNGHLNGQDELLPGVKEFFESIPSDDFVILLSARSSKYKDTTIEYLNKNQIRFDKLILDLPKGERILINDQKPKGLETALAVNLIRNEGLKNIKLSISESI